VRKLRTQRSQNHQLIVNVRTEQTDGANTQSVLSLPTRVILFHLTGQTAQVIRLIQAFSRLDGDRALAKLSLLIVLTLIVFTGVPW
jgi:hypothetical protein